MFNHIASHGYVVIGPHHYAIPENEYQAEWLLDVMNWCEQNLQQMLIDDGFNPGLNIDFTNYFLSGHSSGCHITCEFLKSTGCYATKGIIHISPVDGLEHLENGTVVYDTFCNPPSGEKINYDTPSLILSSGMDNVPGIKQQ